MNASERKIVKTLQEAIVSFSELPEMPPDEGRTKGAFRMYLESAINLVVIRDAARDSIITESVKDVASSDEPTPE